MTRFRKAGLILLGSLVLTSSWAVAQTEEANNILGQAGPSVLALVSYGSDKAEIIKGSALALSRGHRRHGLSRRFAGFRRRRPQHQGQEGQDRRHPGRRQGPRHRPPQAQRQAPGPARRLHRQPDRGRPPLRPGLQRIGPGRHLRGHLPQDRGPRRRGQDPRDLDALPGPVPRRAARRRQRPARRHGVRRREEPQVRPAHRQPRQRAPDGESRRVQVPDPGELLRDRRGEQLRRPGGPGARRADDGPGPPRKDRSRSIRPTSRGISSWPRSIPGRGITPQAVAAYRTVTQLDPNRADAFYGLGTILFKQTQYKDAAEALEKAAALGYAGKEVYLDLGGAYEAIPDFAKAAAAYEKYISLGPADAWAAQLRLGICRTKLEQYDGGHRRPARGAEGPAQRPQGPRRPGRGLRQGRTARERRSRLCGHGRAQSRPRPRTTTARPTRCTRPRESPTGPSPRS